MPDIAQLSLGPTIGQTAPNMQVSPVSKVFSADELLDRIVEQLLWTDPELQNGRDLTSLAKTCRAFRAAKHRTKHLLNQKMRLFAKKKTAETAKWYHARCIMIAPSIEYYWLLGAYRQVRGMLVGDLRIDIN